MGRGNFNWSDVPELYKSGKSLSKIAKIKGSCVASVCYVLEKEGIPRRQGKEANFGRGHNIEKWNDLEELYINKNISVTKIANLKHSIPRTVRKYLKISNIPIRNYAQSQELRAEIAGKVRGRYVGKDGYIFIYKPTHPRANRRGYVREHVLVWEQVHGESIPQGWVVHHLNGVPSDNRPENLMALPMQKHNILIASFQKRIRELEAKISVLERALEDTQVIWCGEN